MFTSLYSSLAFNHKSESVAECEGCTTCGLENTRVALAVALSERLHHAIDLLSFSRQPKTPQELSVRRHTPVVSKSLTSTVKTLNVQKSDTNNCVFRVCKSGQGSWPDDLRSQVDDVLPQGLDQVEVCEFMEFHKGMEHLDIEIIPTGDETWHKCLLLENLKLHFSRRESLGIHAELEINYLNIKSSSYEFTNSSPPQ